MMIRCFPKIKAFTLAELQCGFGCCNTKAKNAFTLAEVLITLAVIGVVAAISIPSLQQKIQDSQNKTALKKFFAEFSNATNLIKADNGNSLRGVIDKTAGATAMLDEYKKYMSFTKTCTSSCTGKTWHDLDTVTNYFGEYPDNAGTPYKVSGGDLGAITSAGGFIIFTPHFDCDIHISNTPARDTACGMIRVDVNGAKAPNRLGKDIFVVYVNEDILIPGGARGTITDAEYEAANGNKCKERIDSNNTWAGYDCTQAVLAGLEY